MPAPRSARWHALAALAVLLLAGCPANDAGTSGGASGANGGASADATGPDSASPASDAKRIIILTNGNSPFWDAARAGLQDAERDLKLAGAGLVAVLDVNDGTAQGQLDKLRQYGSQTDVAGIGISAIKSDNVAIADELVKLRDAGIHVVTIDSDFDYRLRERARTAYLGTDNLAGGRALGTTARQLRPEGGEYVTFVGIPGAQNAIERVSGFAEGAGESFKSKDNMGDEIDRTKARENVRNAIRNHSELNVLVGIWSYNAPAIVDVVKELKVRDRFTLVAFDAEPLAIKEMGEGYLDAMVVQNPYRMGYDGIRLLKALYEGDEATTKEMLPRLGSDGGDIFDTGLKVVVPDEGSPLTADMFEPNVEFLKLSAFRDWLAKYGLEGS